MAASDVCLACSGSVSLELLHHRKPTIIVFKIKRWLMVAQAILMRCKFMTLVNLISTKDIKRKSWRPYDPDAQGAEATLMPEYLTTGDPSDQVAARAVDLLNNEALRLETTAQLDELALKYAIPGATGRAADYILEKTRQRHGRQSSDGPQGVHHSAELAKDRSAA